MMIMYLLIFPFLHSILSLFLPKKKRFYLIWSIQVLHCIYKLNKNESPITMLQAYYLTDLISLYTFKPYSGVKILETTVHHVFSIIVLNKTEYLSLILTNLRYIEYSNLCLIVYYYSNKLINNNTYKVCSLLVETIMYIYFRCVACIKESINFNVKSDDKFLVYLLFGMNIFFSCQIFVCCTTTIVKYVCNKK
jgi:nitrate reductase NapAB chaperone NapD